MMITSRIIPTTVLQQNNNNIFVKNNAFISKRYFFSKRKRSRNTNRSTGTGGGRSKGSLRSRIERKLLEKELASGKSGGQQIYIASSYATIKNPHPLKPRSEIMRYIDPWYDLATLCSKKSQEDILIDKVDSATRIYGVVAALMCSLSAALLAVDFPSVYNESDDDNYNNGDYDNNDWVDNENVDWKVSGEGNYNQNQNHHQSNNNQQHSYSNNALQVSTVDQKQPGESTLQRKPTFIEHVIYDYNTRSTGTSLLVSWGISKHKLSNIYAGCCALSFYSAMTATGLAGVLNAWLSATPPGGISYYTKQNSKFIALVPALLGISKVASGSALFVGLDRSKGTPVSYFGLGGIIISTSIVFFATMRGWNTTYRLIKKLAIKIEKKNIIKQQQQRTATAATATKNN
ncbi:MAG: hypothetical protein ACI8RD_003214 [Bacillariaceae sp.]|jgi:hypothetical protein